MALVRTVVAVPCEVELAAWSGVTVVDSQPERGKPVWPRPRY